MYKNATASQRLFAFLIDLALFIIVFYFISLIVKSVIDIPPVPQELIDYYLELDPNSTVLFEDLMQIPSVAEYFGKVYLALAVNIVSFIFLFISYFVILVYFWDKQTLGRLAMKIKLVYLNEKPLFGTLILREVVGVLLIGILGVCCCCIPGIINLVFLLGKDATTIHDKIANTNIVMNEMIEIDEPEEVNVFDEPKETSIEQPVTITNEDESL